MNGRRVDLEAVAQKVLLYEAANADLQPEQVRNVVGRTVDLLALVFRRYPATVARLLAEHPIREDVATNHAAELLAAD